MTERTLSDMQLEFDTGTRVQDPETNKHGIVLMRDRHLGAWVLWDGMDQPLHHGSAAALVGLEIGPGCEVGPFAHLRPGTRLEKNAKVGNYVEIKNSRLGPDSKTNHLSYVGDGDVGARDNIGAGTIFANYDGTNKSQVTVGDDAFIGSGSVLVAPVTIGENSMTGAGAVVLKGRNVPDGGIVVGVPAKIYKQDGNGDSGDCQN